MSNYKDIIIIGGGASGLVCAIEAAKHNKNILIIEKQNRLGRKLMSTGNGRCNLTNQNINQDKYHGTFKKYLSDIFNKFDCNEILNIFKKYGLITKSDNEGRVYPYSNHASSVLDVLLQQIDNRNIEIIYDNTVIDVTKRNDTFNVTTNNNTYKCKKLVFASGSKANKKLGSDDSGLKILQKLGHKITDLSPALCPIPVKSNSLKSLKGIRAAGKVSLLDKNKVIYEENGEIQFTEKALSGVCIFNLSSYLKECKEPFIVVSLLPDYTYEDLMDLLNDKINKLDKKSNAENILTGIFHYKLSNAILRECKINPSAQISTLTSNDIKRLANLINNWNFKLIDELSFENAQVVAGGVVGDEIYPTTFESKLVDNLFICGEAIDINGDCGGFNLHFAFSSGLIVGKNL